MEPSVLSTVFSTNFFKVSKGLCQGCPLSPFLFILAVEIRDFKIRDATAVRRRAPEVNFHRGGMLRMLRQTVVPMASRHVENVKFEVLALRRKREYYPFQFAK